MEREKSSPPSPFKKPLFAKLLRLGNTAIIFSADYRFYKAFTKPMHPTERYMTDLIQHN